MAIFNSYVSHNQRVPFVGTPKSVASQAGADIQFQVLPAWDAFDRHVLRFTGYFKAGYWVRILKGWLSNGFYMFLPDGDSTSNDQSWMKNQEFVSSLW